MDAQHPESLAAIAERLELLRVAMGYETQAAFARDLAISPQKWSSYLRGTLIPVPVAETLCRSFKVDLNWIYHGDPAGISVGLAKRLEAAKMLREGLRRA